jgi:Trk K+ transport system NAD-binding subunit
MPQRTRLVGYYTIALIGTLVIFTLAYDYGMTAFENRPQPLFQSLQVVTQTFTTVGYGEDAPWTTPVMNFLVVGMQASSLVLIFAALPVFAVPLLEDALATSPPLAIDSLADHVIICTYTPRGEALISELESGDIEYVIVEPDREQATNLYEAGHTVIHGDPESTGTLQNAGIDTATAVVADGSDEVNASIVLAARDTAADVRIFSLVEEGTLAEYHQYAGADRVFSPRQLLGKDLANTARTAISTPLEDVLDLADDFSIVEVPVESDSEVAGQTLADSEIGERTGASMIGAWFDGEFVSPLSADTVLDGGTRLLVLGRDAQLQQLAQLTSSAVQHHRRGRVLIAGFGEVGEAVGDTLTAAGVPWTALDMVDNSGVDIACDVTNPEALREADIEEARTVILALGDDTKAVFATLIIRELNPDVEIVARANETANVRKLYQAGADSVLALASVSGRMVAFELLDGDDGAPSDEQLEAVRTNAPALVGRTLADADVRAQTGVTIIAVERDDDVITGITPSFTVQSDDELIIVGTDAEISQFTQSFG